MATFQTLTVNDTGHLTVPLGTTGQRPGGNGIDIFATPGTYTWTCPAGVTTVRYLSVAGGGGGGNGATSANNGGGGGAGGLLTGNITVIPGNSYTITVGDGGAANTNGANSSITGSDIVSIISIGGGGGGGRQGAPAIAGANGGSGGGGGPASPTTAGLGTAGQGNDGGAGNPSSPYQGGGGGGAGGVGGSPNGNGGAGLASDITGSLVVYAAGGGGGADTSAGVGGSGIGGNGGLPGGALPTAGASGTGSGGGGGSSQNPSISGARGGSGIVVLRYTPVIVSATTGMVRYNSSIYSLEIYTDANDWEPLYTIGSIIFFTTSTAPAGWLKANGATVSRTTYAGLFAVIGTTFGAGDGSTTFTLPDFRGTFPRSLDDGRGVDTGRAVSSYQDQDWKGFYQTNTLQNASSGYSHGPVYMGKTTASYTGALFTGHWRAPAAGLGCMWDTSEMRPKNYALLACIKY